LDGWNKNYVNNAAKFVSLNAICGKSKKTDPLPICVPEKPLIKQKKAAIVGRNQLDSMNMLRNKLTY